MTSETKAGLVVSCSFLCLVGLVFYYKLNGQGNSLADARAEDASLEAPDAPVPITENWTPGGDKQTMIPPTSVQPGSSSENESAHAVSAPGEEKSTLSGTFSAGQGHQGNDSSHRNYEAENSQPSSYELPTQEGAGSKHATSSNSSAEGFSSESAAREKDFKEAGNGASLQPIQENKEPKDSSKASLSLTIDEQIKQAVKDAAASSTDSTKSEVNSSKEEPGTFSPRASETATQPGKNDASTGDSGLDSEPPPIPAKYKHTLPEDPPKGVSPAAAPQAPAKFGRDQGTRKPVSAPAEAPGIKLHVPETVPGASPSRSGGQIQGLTPGVMPSPVLTPPPAGDTAPEPRIQLGRPTPATPPANQLAQGAKEGQQKAPAGFASAAVPLTTATNPVLEKPNQPGSIVPRVESYDEETYICKPGDNFAGISSQYYYSDKYALALLRFNRLHPRAAVGIGQEPPVLQAGQAIFIPPLRILERQFLSTQADANPIAQVGAPSPALADPRNPAVPSLPPGTMPLGKSWSTPSGERTYQVPDQGEMLLEIARKTLGNPERWAEIYRLNPQYDPKYPVPAGTNLRLPADARVAVPEKKPMPVNP